MNEVTPAAPQPEEKKHRVRQIFVWALEIVAIAVSYFQSSTIVRFITTKISMDVVVEVTDRFGADTGHSLSTFLSAIVAEPRLIAVFLTAIILIIDLIVWIVSSTVRTARRRRARRAAINDDYRYLSYGTPEAAQKFGSASPQAPQSPENVSERRIAYQKPVPERRHSGRVADSQQLQADPFDVSYLNGRNTPPQENTPGDPYDVSYLEHPQDHTDL